MSPLAAHVILPRRWELLRLGHGVICPISDMGARRHPKVQPVLAQVDGLRD